MGGLCVGDGRRIVGRHHKAACWCEERADAEAGAVDGSGNPDALRDVEGDLPKPAESSWAWSADKDLW